MCVRVCVLYRNPNCRTDQDEIWHRGVPQERKGSWVGFDLVPPTPQLQGAQRGSGGLWSLNCAFWRKLYRTKVAWHPQISGGLPIWTPNPDPKGPGPEGEFIKSKL